MIYRNNTELHSMLSEVYKRIFNVKLQQKREILLLLLLWDVIIWAMLE